MNRQKNTRIHMEEGKNDITCERSKKIFDTIDYGKVTQMLISIEAPIHLMKRIFEV
jgi:hypothetical protein